MAKPKRALGLRSPTPRRILIIHGPNLDMLGTREPGIYGKESLADINERLGRIAKLQGAALETFQSNHEGALIERVHRAKEQRISWIIVNPGGVDSYQRGSTRRSCSGRDSVSRGASVEHLLQGTVPASFVLFRPRGGYDLRTRRPGVRVRLAVRLALKLRACFGVVS